MTEQEYDETIKKCDETIKQGKIILKRLQKVNEGYKRMIEIFKKWFPQEVSNARS